ncbi:MAG: gluconokinase, GntK/IdnK-type [Pseudomonadota bacterium]|nr:gluconokinase, GntK/IdnK-type [Pseudomonadota bacterium]
MSFSTAPLVVVMGVSGAGKTTLGPLLARQLNAEFLEGEHLHPARNQERMAAGIPLTDNDRRDWLLEIAQQLADATAGRHALVVSCPALRRADRDRLRTGASTLAFVHLTAPAPLLGMRLPSRHTVPDPPLQVQMQILEPPGADERALTLDAGLPPTELATQAAAWLTASKPDNGRRK